jgi:hypothetical protein
MWSEWVCGLFVKRPAIVPACRVIVLCLALPATLSGQTPRVLSTLDPAFYTVPLGMKPLCAVNASDGTASAICPVIQYDGLTTWAYGFDDNRFSLGIVTYDASGKIVNEVATPGARNVYKITSDPYARSVTFWGEGDTKVVVPWSLLGKPNVYTWVSAAVPPANAVVAPDPPYSAVCRGMGQYGWPWVGYWDGVQCIGNSAGVRMPIYSGIQFLVVTSGNPQWRSAAYKASPGHIGDLPVNGVNAGNEYRDQIVCSQSGYVGWVSQNRCALPAYVSAQQNATVLVGTVQ